MIYVLVLFFLSFISISHHQASNQQWRRFIHSSLWSATFSYLLVNDHVGRRPWSTAIPKMITVLYCTVASFCWSSRILASHHFSKNIIENNWLASNWQSYRWREGYINKSQSINQEERARQENKQEKMVQLKDIKINIPPFYDKNVDEFYRWWPQMQAYSVHKKFDVAILCYGRPSAQIRLCRIQK